MSTGFKTGVLVSAFLTAAFGVSAPTVAESRFSFERIEYRLPFGVIVLNANALLQPKSPVERELVSRFLMHVTAYSSSVDETDETPYTTAAGTPARDGIVASNLFMLGTRIRIPELFGDRVLVVEDRMHERFTDRLDVWMPSKWWAFQFGKKQAEVEIVEL